MHRATLGFNTQDVLALSGGTDEIRNGTVICTISYDPDLPFNAAGNIP
jgi:hypothetical protein